MVLRLNRHDIGGLNMKARSWLSAAPGNRSVS